MHDSNKTPPTIYDGVNILIRTKTLRICDIFLLGKFTQKSFHKELRIKGGPNSEMNCTSPVERIEFNPMHSRIDLTEIYNPKRII